MKIHFEYIMLDRERGITTENSVPLFDRTVEGATSFDDAVAKLAIEAGVPGYVSTHYSATHVDYDMDKALAEYHAARKAAFNL